MKLYDLPIKTFNPERLMEEIYNAKDGDVFVINEKHIPAPEGDDITELTIIQVKKVRD